MCDLQSTFLTPLSLRFLHRHYALPSYPSHPRAYKPARSFSLPPSLALFLATLDVCPAPLQPTLADRELPLSLLSTLGRAACSDARRAASCCPNSSPPHPFSPPGARDLTLLYLPESPRGSSGYQRPRKVRRVGDTMIFLNALFVASDIRKSWLIFDLCDENLLSILSRGG